MRSALHPFIFPGLPDARQHETPNAGFRAERRNQESTERRNRENAGFRAERRNQEAENVRIRKFSIHHYSGLLFIKPCGDIITIMNVNVTNLRRDLGGFLNTAKSEPVVVSRKKREEAVILSCFEYGRLTKIEFGVFSFLDDAENVDSLIVIARNFISGEVADRLSELHKTPLDDDELPLNIESVRYFLKFCFFRRVNERPVMAATQDGLTGASWENGEEEAGIRFLGNKKAWLILKTKTINACSEVRCEDLLSGTITLPGWIK